MLAITLIRLGRKKLPFYVGSASGKENSKGEADKDLVKRKAVEQKKEEPLP